MQIKLTATLDDTPENRAFCAAMQAAAEAEWPATLARLHEQSRLSGLDVVYDLTMFDEIWSPIFRFGRAEPVAWVNNRTGRRSEGPDHPGEPEAEPRNAPAKK